MFQQLQKIYHYEFYIMFLLKSFFEKKRLPDAIGLDYLKFINLRFYQLHT